MHPDTTCQPQREPIAFRTFAQNGWKGLVLDAWHDFPEFADLDAWLDDTEADLILTTHCRTIKRYNTPRGVLYAKLMRAQNDGVILKNERFSKFKWKFYPSRAICIVKTTAAMLRAGHHCPLPVMGVRRRNRGPMPQDLYVATEILDPTVEERLLKASSQEERKTVLAICGRNLAAFHRDGFVHGDFLPRNTCLSHDNQTFSYLDNDRTRRWPNTPIFHFKRRNLTQFCFNLFVLGFKENLDLPKALLNAYADAAGWTKARINAEFDTIMEQNNRRWKQAMLAKQKRHEHN